MDYAAALADPLADVRDVVETFRQVGATPRNWDADLAAAVEALDHLPDQAGVSDLVERLRALLQHGLTSDPRAVEQVANLVSALLRETKVPGIPSPDEDYWGFFPARPS
jgi:hypothetical protein